MDEVGRGTGTHDGLSIAWAVCEDLLNRIRCRTLFATHYHELSLLDHPHLANRSMEVLEQDNTIIFLRKLREGPSAESYGIHVARLAGLPEPLLERASDIMESLREREKPAAAQPSFKKPEKEVNPDKRFIKLAAELSSLDTNNMTPLDALKLVSKWKGIYSVNNYTAKKGRDAPDLKTPSLFEE
jgi:DNA mismatch repair protein MutS